MGRRMALILPREGFPPCPTVAVLGGTECLKEKCPWYSTEFATACLVIDGCNAFIAATEVMERLRDQMKTLESMYAGLAAKRGKSHAR